jgi:hypothetical protein
LLIDTPPTPAKVIVLLEALPLLFWPEDWAGGKYK